MKEEILPIGTVVMLKGGTKRVMIIGVYPIENETKKIYDYSGCLYPEGLLSSEEIYVFNHNEIDKIFHLGLEDDEEKEYVESLKTLDIKK